MAAGVKPGTFEVRIPVAVDAVAVGVQTGTNTVNLSGGGDPLCTALTGEACDATTSPTEVRPGVPSVHILKEVISESAIQRFRFALSGLSVSSDTIEVRGPGLDIGAQTITGTAGVPVTITETSPAGWPVNPVNAYCENIDDSIQPSPAPSPMAMRRTARAPVSGALPPVVWVGNTLTIPAEWMVPGANIRVPEAAFEDLYAELMAWLTDTRYEPDAYIYGVERALAWLADRAVVEDGRAVVPKPPLSDEYRSAHPETITEEYLWAIEQYARGGNMTNEYVRGVIAALDWAWNGNDVRPLLTGWLADLQRSR